MKLLFGGFQRRGLEAIMAALVLTLANAIVASGLMVISGAHRALLQAEANDRPDIIKVKSRFNRALFETPRSGSLPPLTLPVYEPLIDPAELSAAAGGVVLVMRQSLLRNVVSPDGFQNVYLFGIDPDLERRVSRFSIAAGRFLRPADQDAAVLDRTSAQALGVGLGNHIAIRKADGHDLSMVVVGILDDFALRDAPPTTIDAPELHPKTGFVSGGIFVTLAATQQIFGRVTLTDALALAPGTAAAPALVEELRQGFRLEQGIFVSERFSLFNRKVHDFNFSLGFFSLVGAAVATLAGALVAFLLDEVYTERRQQHAILAALGFSPLRNVLMLIAVSMSVALIGAILGGLIAVLAIPEHFGMPSLMADLGTIEPRFDVTVGTVVGALSATACGVGVLPTAWRLSRNLMAAELAQART